MRIFMTRWFTRFAQRKRITKASLRKAIARADRGLIDAGLGGGLIKQRVARQEQGRSGGYRVIIAYKAKNRAIFLFGFAKSEMENIAADQLAVAHEIARKLLAADDAHLAQTIGNGELQEVQND